MIRRKTKRAKIEGKFAKALTEEVVTAATLDYPVVAGRLRRLQRLYLAMLPPKSSDAIEIKRRIAEQMYQQAFSHECSGAVCRAKFRSLTNLGFQDVERKAHFHLLEALAALSRGENQLARKRTTRMVRELERAPRRGRNPLRKSLLRTLQSLNDSIPR